MNKKLRVGIVGFGNMGRAIAESLSSGKYDVYVYDKDKNKTKGIPRNIIVKTLKGLLSESEAVILAVKPQDIKEFIEGSRGFINRKTLLISIAAGVPTYFFEKSMGRLKIVRVMPNLAARVKEAVSFICKGRFASKKDLDLALSIFKNIGIVFKVKEGFLDKATSISGSGPGYIYYFMDSLMQAALGLGFDRKTAREMVQYTFLGAVKLAIEGRKDFSVLVKNVASRGGTTEAALRIFERRKVSYAINDAVGAAYKRAKELTKASL